MEPLMDIRPGREIPADGGKTVAVVYEFVCKKWIFFDRRLPGRGREVESHGFYGPGDLIEVTLHLDEVDDKLYQKEDEKTRYKFECDLLWKLHCKGKRLNDIPMEASSSTKCQITSDWMQALFTELLKDTINARYPIHPVHQAAQKETHHLEYERHQKWGKMILDRCSWLQRVEAEMKDRNFTELRQLRVKGAKILRDMEAAKHDHVGIMSNDLKQLREEFHKHDRAILDEFGEEYGKMMSMGEEEQPAELGKLMKEGLRLYNEDLLLEQMKKEHLITHLEPMLFQKVVAAKKEDRQKDRDDKKDGEKARRRGVRRLLSK